MLCEFFIKQKTYFLKFFLWESDISKCYIAYVPPRIVLSSYSKLSRRNLCLNHYLTNFSYFLMIYNIAFHNQPAISIPHASRSYLGSTDSRSTPTTNFTKPDLVNFRRSTILHFITKSLEATPTPPEVIGAPWLPGVQFHVPNVPMFLSSTHSTCT